MSHRGRWIGVACLLLVLPGVSVAQTTAPKHEAVIEPRTQIEAQSLMLEYEQAMRSYEQLGLSVRDEIRVQIRAEAARRIKYINDVYDAESKGLDTTEEMRRGEAIRLFKRFVERYPDHEKHTPDAFFRLAELQYEQAELDYLEAEDRHAERLGLYQRGKLADEPESPEKDYSGVIHSLSRLVQRFGDYRFTDAALYLLGFTQVESGKDDEGRASYLALVDRFPKSEYAPEALLRLGELEFELTEYEAAVEYYKKILRYPKSKYYDLALYKLAWAFYQMFAYDDAINTFKQLVAYYDDQAAAAEGGKLDARQGQLRAEAIEYVAKALAEDDWDGDGEVDPQAGPDRALQFVGGRKKAERDILAAYGDVLYDLHDTDKYKHAVRIYERLLKLDAQSPAAPTYQEKIIKVYDTLRDFVAGASARHDMVRRFGPRSDWRQLNANDTDALKRAAVLVEVAAHQRAQFHHLRAQELKVAASGDRSKLAESVDEYRRAADAYADFLEAYPKTEKRNEARFFMGEAYYYAGDFRKAAETYAAVRDDKGAESFRAEAAFSAIKAYEKEMARLADRGRVPSKAVPGRPNKVKDEPLPEDQDAGPTRVTPEPIPPILLDWVASIDIFVNAGLKRKDDPDAASGFAYQAAEMLYRFREFEKARPRLSVIIDKYPDKQVAGYAAALIINSYKIENDWANIQKWAGLMEEKNLGRPEDQAALKAAIKVFKLGAQFKTAEQLLEKKEYVKAADEFSRLAQDPSLKFADKALFNAAMAYKEAKHYDKASRAFETILTEKRFQKSEFRDMALFQVAENSKKFFDFSKAISSYLALYRRDKGNENSPYSLFQAASLLDDDGQQAEAARLFEEYERTFSRREDAPFALYRAARAWAKLNETRKEEKALKAFVKRARTKKDMGQVMLESMVRLGEIELARNKEKAARTWFQETIAVFRQRGFAEGSAEADAAGRAQFEIIEMAYRRYAALQLAGSMAQMGRILQQASAMREDLEAGYAEVFPYGSLEWTFAAFFRIGEIYQSFAQKLYDAPEPPGFDTEELEIYRTQLEDEGTRFEDIAVQRYEEMMKEARARKVTNAWVKKALEFLNRYKPAEYPLAREEKELHVWNEAWSLPPVAAGGDAVLTQALDAMRNGRLVDARGSLARHLDKGQGGVDAARLYVRVSLLLGDRADALQRAEVVARKSSNDLAARNLALYALVKGGRAAAALREARPVLERDAVNTETMRNIARAYITLGKLDTARYVLGRALEVKDEAATHRLLGEIAFKKENLNVARAELEAAAKGLPYAPEVWNGIGVIAARMADYQGASDALDQLTRTYPGLAFGHANKGYVLRLQSRPAEAEAAYRKALSLDDRLAEVHYNLAMLYFSTEITGKSAADRYTDAIRGFGTYRNLRRGSLSREEAETVDRYIEEAKRMMEMDQQSGQSAEPAGADDGGGDVWEE